MFQSSMWLHSEIFTTLQEKGNRETANKKHSNHTALTYTKKLKTLKHYETKLSYNYDTPSCITQSQKWRTTTRKTACH